MIKFEYKNNGDKAKPIASGDCGIEFKKRCDIPAGTRIGVCNVWQLDQVAMDIRDMSDMDATILETERQTVVASPNDNAICSDLSDSQAIVLDDGEIAVLIPNEPEEADDFADDIRNVKEWLGVSRLVMTK